MRPDKVVIGVSGDREQRHEIALRVLEAIEHVYGPKPPAGDKPHGYHFQVFALDTMLNLPVGFNRQALLDAMKGHVVAKGETVGMYQRKPDVRDKK